MRGDEIGPVVKLLENALRITTLKRAWTGQVIRVRVRLFSDWTTFTDNEDHYLPWTHSVNNNCSRLSICKTKHCFQEAPSRHVFCMCFPGGFASCRGSTKKVMVSKRLSSLMVDPGSDRALRWRKRKNTRCRQLSRDMSTKVPLLRIADARLSYYSGEQGLAGCHPHEKKLGHKKRLHRRMARCARLLLIRPARCRRQFQFRWADRLTYNKPFDCPHQVWPVSLR
jgi:hypothetical protein